MALGSAMLVSRTVFPLFSGNSDEAVYVYQAKVLEQGDLTVSDADHGGSFRPWLTGEHQGRRFTQYQPGWPLVLAAADALTGSMRLALGITAAAAVIAVYLFTRELLRDSRVALLAAVLVATSPFFLLHSALFLNYLFTTTLLMFSGWAFIRGLRSARFPGYGVLAGALLGYALLTRPFDAVLWAAVLGAVALSGWRQQDRGRFVRTLGGLALGFVPFVALTLAYNSEVTGSALRFPLNATDPLNRFGFGTRRLLPDVRPIDYDAGEAFGSLRDNLQAVPSWILGGVFALGLAGLGAVRRRGWVLLIAALLFPAAYLFWWATDLSGETATNGIGPHYYIPSMTALMILAAAGIVALWEWRRAAVIIAAVVMVAATALAVPDKLQDKLDITANVYRPYERALGHLPRSESLVFLPPETPPYVLWPLPFLMNEPDLTGRVLYAADTGAQNVRAVERYPNRTPFRLARELMPGDDLFRPTVTLTPLTLERSSTIVIQLRIRNPGTAPNVLVYARDGDQRRVQQLDSGSEPSETYTVEWLLASPQTRVRPELADRWFSLSGDGGELRLGVAFGSSELVDRDSDLWERRFHFRVVGDQIRLLRPGQEWHRLTFGNSVWVGEDVAPVLDENP